MTCDGWTRTEDWSGANLETIRNVYMTAFADNRILKHYVANYYLLLILNCRYQIPLSQAPMKDGTTKSPRVESVQVCEPLRIPSRFAALLWRSGNLGSPRITDNAERAFGRPWFNVIPIVCVEV